MSKIELVRRQQMATACVVVGFLSFDLVTPWLLDQRWIHRHEGVVYVFVGICIGQVNLIAVWAALAPGNIVLRLPWAVLMSVLMWYSFVMGNRVLDYHFRVNDALMLGVILLGGIIAAQSPLWLARWLMRWRIVMCEQGFEMVEEGTSVLKTTSHEHTQSEKTTLSSSQFHLRDMLLGMVFLSIALAPARAVLPPGEFTEIPLRGEMILVLGAVAVCNLLITIPCVWGAFMQSILQVPVVLGWVFYCAVVTLAETVVLIAIAGPPPDATELFFWAFLLNLTQCATVFLTLLLFRALGLRLLRGAKRGKLTTEKVAQP